jgi:membrane protease YdiL (CAAX protease family)
MDEAILAVGGTVAAVVGWRFVARGASVWAVMAPLMGLLGVLSLVIGDPGLARRTSTRTAALTGLGAGVLLYLGTVAFVWVVKGWERFRRHAADVYDLRKGLPVLTAVLLGAGVVALGEELFWRGLVQPRAAVELGRTGGAIVAWLAYIGVNVASGSLPLIAGGIVAGGVWGLLAWWSGGVLASVCCHSLWTGLMIALPPKAIRA